MTWYATRIAKLAVCLTAVLTLLAFGARWNWLCELTIHWRLQIALAAALACLALLPARKWKFALLAGTVALINAAHVVPFYLPQQQNAVVGPTWRVVSANVHTSNRNARPFLEFIRSVRPDFVLVLEIDAWWQRALAELGRDYPHSVIRPQAERAGIALFSRHPIVSYRVESLDDMGDQTIFATFDFGGQPLNVVGIHPVAPVERQRAERRDQHLHALGALVAQLPQPTIVLGDFNTTSWSPCFDELVQRSGLRDSRLGFGLQPTWPDGPWVVRIPIDHALVSRDMVVTQRYVGPDIGSDHLPIVIAFAAERGAGIATQPKYVRHARQDSNLRPAD